MSSLQLTSTCDRRTAIVGSVPKPHKRAKARAQKARETQIAQREAEAKKVTPEQYMRKRALGWILVALAVAVGTSHWLAHLGALYEATPLSDLVAGYPLAAALGIGGAIVLSD